jgi:hypothetical protein
METPGYETLWIVVSPSGAGGKTVADTPDTSRNAAKVRRTVRYMVVARARGRMKCRLGCEVPRAFRWFCILCAPMDCGEHFSLGKDAGFKTCATRCLLGHEVQMTVCMVVRSGDES